MFSKVSREHIALGTQFLRDDLVDVVPMLFKNLFNPNYQVYEFLRNLNSTLKETNAHLSDPHTLVQDKLHQVAYRTGLGNSLYASKESLNQFVRKDVKDYISKLFSSGRIAVVATGVDHSELKNLVDQSLEGLNLKKESVVTEQSKYFGGEARIEAGPNSKAIYSVGFPSVAYTKKEYAAALVLKSLLGGSPRTRYGNPAGVLAKASTPNTSTSAFIHVYQDTGLLGFTVEGQNSEVKKVVKDSLEALKAVSTSISEDSLQAAKNTAIVDYDSSLSSDGVLEALTREAFGAGQVLTDSDAISKVTASDVQKVRCASNYRLPRPLWRARRVLQLMEICSYYRMQMKSKNKNIMVRVKLTCTINISPTIPMSNKTRRPPDYLITSRRKEEDVRLSMAKTAQDYAHLKQKVSNHVLT